MRATRQQMSDVYHMTRIRLGLRCILKLRPPRSGDEDVDPLAQARLFLIAILPAVYSAGNLQSSALASEGAGGR